VAFERARQYAKTGNGSLLAVEKLLEGNAGGRVAELPRAAGQTQAKPAGI
jgi:hypothetical protein